MDMEKAEGDYKNELDRAKEKLLILKLKNREKASPSPSPPPPAGPQAEQQRRVRSAPVGEAGTVRSGEEGGHRWGATAVAHGGTPSERQDSSRAATATMTKPGIGAPQDKRSPLTAGWGDGGPGSGAQGRARGGGGMIRNRNGDGKLHEVQRGEGVQPQPSEMTPEVMSNIEAVQGIVESLQQVTAAQKGFAAPQDPSTESSAHRWGTNNMEHKNAIRFFSRAAMKSAQEATKNGGINADEGALSKFEKRLSREGNQKRMVKYLDAARNAELMGQHATKGPVIRAEEEDPFTKVLGSASHVPRRSGSAPNEFPDVAVAVDASSSLSHSGDIQCGDSDSADAAVESQDAEVKTHVGWVDPCATKDRQGGESAPSLVPLFGNRMASAPLSSGSAIACGWEVTLLGDEDLRVENALKEIDFPAPGASLPRERRRLGWGETDASARENLLWVKIGSFDEDTAGSGPELAVDSLNWGVQASLQSLEKMINSVWEGSRGLGCSAGLEEGVQGEVLRDVARGKHWAPNGGRMESKDTAKVGDGIEKNPGAPSSSLSTVEEEVDSGKGAIDRNKDSADWEDELEIEDEDLDQDVAFISLAQCLGAGDHEMRVAYVTDQVIGIRSTWPDGYEIIEEFLVDMSKSGDESLFDVDENLVLGAIPDSDHAPVVPGSASDQHGIGGTSTDTLSARTCPSAGHIEDSPLTPVPRQEQGPAIQVGTSVRVTSRNFRFKDAVGTVVSLVGNGRRARVKFEGVATPSLVLVASLVPALARQEEDAGGHPLYRGPSVPPAAMTPGTSWRWWKTRTSPDCHLDKSRFHSNPRQRGSQ